MAHAGHALVNLFKVSHFIVLVSSILSNDFNSYSITYQLLLMDNIYRNKLLQRYIQCITIYLWLEAS